MGLLSTLQLSSSHDLRISSTSPKSLGGASDHSLGREVAALEVVEDPHGKTCGHDELARGLIDVAAETLQTLARTPFDAAKRKVKQ